MIETHLINMLARNDAVADLVGGMEGAVNTARIYMVELPAAAVYPCVCITGISTDEGRHLKGPDGTREDRLQIDSFAVTLTEAATLAKAIYEALKNYHGVRDGVVIHSTAMINRRNLSQPQARIKQISMDWELWNRDAVA